MANSHHLFDIIAPQNVVNTILAYEGSYTVSHTFGTVPLVSTIFHSIKLQKLPRIKALLTAIVSGQQDTAEVILKKDASLALEKLEEKDFVTAPTGHRFNLKPYQAALAVRDFEMAKMIKSYLDVGEADRQFSEQARGKMINEKPIFEQLNQLSNAIYRSKDDIILSDSEATVKQGSLVEKELHKFWKLLDATLDEIITIDKKPFIPDRLLSKALQLYRNRYMWWSDGAYGDRRTWLFVQRVMGYDGIQRIMPVNYIQDFRYIPYDWSDQIHHHSTKFGYRVDCNNVVQIDFYPLLPRSSKGFHFFTQGSSLCSLPRKDTYVAQNLFSQRMSIKEKEMSELMPQRARIRSSMA
jgi:hypothetical protein